MRLTSKKIVGLVGIFAAIFTAKMFINYLLLAENGDTYDFFKIAYFLKEFNLNYQSKRMPFLPVLLTPFSPDYFVFFGRFWINLFYFAGVLVFYKYLKTIINKNYIALLATLVFATNILVFENSFYILADTIFLFFNILFLYVLKTKGTKNPLILSIIGALAFYTRPEGALLLLIAGILYLIKLIKNKNIVSVKQLFIFGISGILFILPYFLNNYYFYGSYFYNGYLQDEAGFIFDRVTIITRISNFLFGVGGIWLLPVLYLLVKQTSISLKHLYKNYLPEVLVFFLYSIVLFLWGPYFRLYSVPITLLITATFVLLNNVKQVKVKFVDYIVAGFLVLMLSAFYLYVVQIIDHTDLGYRKYGKFLSLAISTLIIANFYFKNLFKLNYKKVLLIFTTLVILLNLAIFIDKFRITRFKYYTLKQATLNYLNNYKNEGNLGYNSNSDLERWYTKDFDNSNDYMLSNLPFMDYVKTNNIKYIVVTKEAGFNDKFTDYANLSKRDLTVIQTYKSPFFPGDTKLIRLNY